MPTLTPWRQAGSVGDPKSHAPIILKPAGGTPTPTQSPGTSRNSDKSNSETHEISTGPSSIGVSHDSSSSSRKPLPDQSHSLSNSGKAGGDCLLSAVHGMNTVLTSYVCSEEIVFKTVRRIDEMVEVAYLVISSFSTHHTSASGARA